MADYTQDEIKAELLSRGAIAPEEEPAREGSSIGFFSHPIDNTIKAGRAVQDFAGGFAGSAQRAASTLGEAGQAIGNFAAAPFRKYVPESLKVVPNVNIREELGLGQTNPFDLKQAIAHNPNSFAAGLGQFAFPLMAGGASIPRQMLYNGLWGATQADPEQENLGGILPNGRTGEAIKDAALTGAGGLAAKEIMAGLPTVKNAINYFRPDKSAKDFLQTLGKGTKEENARALSQIIQDSHAAQAEDALQHKTPVYQQEGKSEIYRTPITALPEGNLDKVAHYIQPGEKTTPEQLDKLGKEIQNYRTGVPGKDGKPTYDFEDFTHNVQEIFNANLKPNQIENLENSLLISPEQKGKFLNLAENNSKLITGKTRPLYDKFLKKQTLNNADDLQSQLGSDLGKYQKQDKLGLLNKAGSDEMAAIKEMRDALKSDMQAHLTRKNPKLAEENQKFVDKYRENVAPYGEEEATRTITNEPDYVSEKRAEKPNLSYNVTSGELHKFFSEPTRAGSKVAEDIGDEGRRKVLYNLLADDANPNAKGLANAILNAKQSGGYQNYITPEMEDLANLLFKRVKWRKRAAYGAGGLAGAVGIGATEEAIRHLLFSK